MLTASPHSFSVVEQAALVSTLAASYSAADLSDRVKTMTAQIADLESNDGCQERIGFLKGERAVIRWAWREAYAAERRERLA